MSEQALSGLSLQEREMLEAFADEVRRLRARVLELEEARRNDARKYKVTLDVLSLSLAELDGDRGAKPRRKK